MLGLAGERSLGAHPYFTPVEHTALAREILGPRPLLCVELSFALTADRRQAQADGMRYFDTHLGFESYRRNLLRLGFAEDELTSDLTFDRIVAWGGVEAVLDRVRQHLDAGADHVCLQALPTERIQIGQVRELAAALGELQYSSDHGVLQTVSPGPEGDDLVSEQQPDAASPELAVTCPVAHPSAFDWPATAVTECPYPFYEALRAPGSVYHREGTDDYYVSRWEDLVQVATQVDRFSSGLLQSTDEALIRTRGQEVGATSVLKSGRSTPYPSASSDPPEHRAKRSLGLRMMTNERLRSYEPMIAAYVDTLIDRWIDRGRCDFRTEFSDVLPVEVICDIMGQPPQVRRRLQEWSDIEAGGAAKFASQERRRQDAARAQAMSDYLRGQILQQHENPQPGFLSELIQAQIAIDGEFDLEFVVAEAVLLIFAGNITTAHLIASSTLELCRRPELAAQLRRDSSGVPGFIEEMLRLESPLQWSQRRCVEDTEVGGTLIPKGAWVLMFWASGNRDPRRFTDAAELRTDRQDLVKRQLAFGYGMHRCSGAPLARLEARIAIETLLRRLNNMRIDEAVSDLRNIDSVRFRAPALMALTFERSA